MKFSTTILFTLAAALVASVPIDPNSNTTTTTLSNKIQLDGQENLRPEIGDAFIDETGALWVLEGDETPTETNDKRDAEADARVIFKNPAEFWKKYFSNNGKSKPHYTSYGPFEPQKRDAEADARVIFKNPAEFWKKYFSNNGKSKPHYTSYGPFEPQKRDVGDNNNDVNSSNNGVHLPYFMYRLDPKTGRKYFLLPYYEPQI
ncbi:uncharacterized protein KGF55_001035 [Candida pseudojiufengensis]|uniref:uncharacterized protein n=1 Tax=Candida pseudojiufengensis TaxID=497109 RepID=UPI0022242A1F|nr:uncharacterized protein KGF55_001035 [Candida pseudojiufengensis]KAI5965673.1 hypothetical protein KGF55_001035 [Candida pseudojiufengensis]